MERFIGLEVDQRILVPAFWSNSARSKSPSQQVGSANAAAKPAHPGHSVTIRQAQPIHSFDLLCFLFVQTCGVTPTMYCNSCTLYNSLNISNHHGAMALLALRISQRNGAVLLAMLQLVADIVFT